MLNAYGYHRTHADLNFVYSLIKVTDLISALNYQIDARDNPHFCMLQAVTMQFFEVE